MKHIRSADPWSSFLEPAAGGMSAPHGVGFMAESARARHDGDAGLPAASRRVLDALQSEGHGELTVDELHDRAGLSLLEVADAVKELYERGLVGLLREADDEVVRLTEPGAEAAAGDAGPTG